MDTGGRGFVHLDCSALAGCGRRNGTQYITMHVSYEKSFQQDVVAEFVDDHRLEYCMFVYLDAFLDTHRAMYPDLVDRWDPYAMYEMLEEVYNGIRLDLLKHGLLTNKAAGKYVMKRSQ
ncbi:hypothetical protein K457DRAFT_23056 [Linnemannia elongata AG-77]|uniref:Uncharacterized protein n=1 Tax=Linnemannia elongata AG-77 TaxID=1314771 RepID=A0A197JKU4_9FUNG|nr:hypothetical protein K457DRAFT_23056 [Linnemannia elongata AG-77]